LPQGAPISPLLANLFLDEFDEELLGRDYRLVRYADDFVILCRDPAEAERARADAQAALADLGLTLNEGKTAVTTFDAGFSYLGYLFCRSLVMEKQGAALIGPWQSGEAPRHSWLAQLPLRDVRALERGGAGEPHVKADAVPLAEVNPPPVSPTRTLHLSGPRTRVSRRGELLVIEHDDEPADEIRLRDVAHVVLHGPVNLTMPALLALGRAGTPVYACRQTGELDVPLVMSRPDWRLWEMQARRAADTPACLEVARSVVQAKLHNSATVAVRLRFQGSAALAQKLRMAERACGGATDLDLLRGHEGRGAALFFAALRDSLSPEWGFRQRLRQPPPDPINAMLSYGYTMLYAHVSTALIGAGLNPDLGFLHRQQDGTHALACDLEEEMRHLVDSLVWAVVQRRELKPSDFGPSEDGRYPCLLSPAARRKFIARFEVRLLTEFKPRGDDSIVTYREFVWRQATAMRDFIAGRAAGYEPLRIHA
jgi:CRISPR-associated protein Cas1